MKKKQTEENALTFPYIVFETTTDCNLNCSYCYTVLSRNKNNICNINSYKTAKKTLKKLFNAGKINQITMTGGEPFVCERFKELVLYCRMKNTEVAIITNGTSASEEDYRQMIDVGVSLFELPIHSPTPDIHDVMTGISGSWEKSVNSVKQILKNNGNVVAVIVITKNNFNYVGKTIEFISSLGMKHIMLNRYNIGGRSINKYADILPDFDELNSAYAEAHQIAAVSDLTITSNVCTPFCVLDPEKYPSIQFSACSSSTENMPLTLDSLGNMRLCNHSPTVIGNIFNNTIGDIINTETVKTWHETVPNYCKKCEIYYKCRGGCRAASEQLGYSLDVVDPVISILNDKGGKNDC